MAKKTGRQLDAEIARVLDDDDDVVPTAAEIEAALTKVRDLVAYLRRNALGYDEEREKAEARKFRKRADRIVAALLVHDLAQLRKLTSSAQLELHEQLSDRDLDPLSYGWAAH